MGGSKAPSVAPCPSPGSAAARPTTAAENARCLLQPGMACGLDDSDVGVEPGMACASTGTAGEPVLARARTFPSARGPPGRGHGKATAARRGPGRARLRSPPRLPGGVSVYSSSNIRDRWKYPRDNLPVFPGQQVNRCARSSDMLEQPCHEVPTCRGEHVRGMSCHVAACGHMGLIWAASCRGHVGSICHMPGSPCGGGSLCESAKWFEHACVIVDATRSCGRRAKIT